MNYQNEFKEYVQNNYVQSIKLNKISNIITMAYIVTLEGEELEIECSIYNGLKIKNQNNSQFENMEQILSTYSKQYVEKFSNDLFQKLSNIKQDDIL